MSLDTTKELLDYGQTMDCSYFGRQFLNSWKGGSVYTVFGNSYVFGLGTFIATAGTPYAEQAAKIRWYMNCYEEMIIESYSRNWQPAFHEADMNAFNTAWYDINTVGIADQAHQNYFRAVCFLNDSTVTYIPEHNNFQLRETIGELSAVMARPDSQTFRLSQPYTVTFYPKNNQIRQAMIPSQQDANFTNAAAMQAVSMGQVTGIGAATNKMYLESGPASDVGWISTKVTNPATGTIAYNYDSPYTGYRQYYHLPQNESKKDVQIHLGTYTYNLRLRFRKPDYRAFLAVPVFSVLNSQEDMDQLLDSVEQFNGVVSQELERPMFISKSDTESQKDEIKAKYRVKREPDPVDEEEQPPSKRPEVYIVPGL